MYVSDKGTHWNLIGFQGLDPSTDLNRSMGVLSLYLTLSMIEGDPELAKKIYANSKREPGDWPFMCVCVGFTLDAVKSFRSGGLYQRANAVGSVISAIRDLFVGLFVEFLERCHRETQVHHAVHLNAVKKECEEKGCAKFIGRYAEYLSTLH